MSLTIRKPAHVGISVQNMTESMNWYKNNLGFSLAADYGFIPQLRAKMCLIQNGTFQIELFEYGNPKSLPMDCLFPDKDIQTVGTKHIAFEVENMSQEKEFLLKNRVKIIQETNLNGKNIMFIHDCNNIVIELIEV